jgi:hypothetical protein
MCDSDGVEERVASQDISAGSGLTGIVTKSIGHTPRLDVPLEKDLEERRSFHTLLDLFYNPR